MHNRRASEILVPGFESVRVGVNLLRHLAPAASPIRAPATGAGERPAGPEGCVEGHPETTPARARTRRTEWRLWIPRPEAGRLKLAGKIVRIRRRNSGEYGGCVLGIGSTLWQKLQGVHQTGSIPIPHPAFSSRASESGLPGLCEMDRVPARPDVVLECRFEGVRTAISNRTGRPVFF